MSALAPIALFVYRRALHTEKVLQALAACPESRASDLVVFADGARDESQREAVEATRAVVRSSRGFRSARLVIRESNMGLSGNIRSGIDEVLAGSDSAIFLEDDIEVAPDFLSFMNKALAHYARRRDVHSISGFLYPVALDADFPYDTVLLKRFSCWGWGTWRDRWRAVAWGAPNRKSFLRSTDFVRLWQVSNDLPELMLDLIDGKNDSWAVQFNRSQIAAGGYSVHPVRSLTRNTGLDGTGTHSRQDRRSSPVPLHGFGGLPAYRFADTYDEQVAEPVRRFFEHGPRRKLKNLFIYGRYF